MIRYEKKLGKAEFRLGRVLDSFPDDKGRTRTVLVGCRPRHKADRTKEYVPKQLEELTVTVQRLVVLLAVEEQHLLPPAATQDHVCDEQLVMSDAQQQPPRRVHFADDQKDDDDAVSPVSLAALSLHYPVTDVRSHCWQCVTRVLVSPPKRRK